MIASLVIYRDLDFVRLVNVKLMPLLDPAVVPGGLGAAFDSVFDLDVDESLGSSAEATSGCVIDIGNGVHCKSKMTTQWLALAGHTQAVVCGRS